MINVIFLLLYSFHVCQFRILIHYSDMLHAIHANASYKCDISLLI